MALHQDIEQRKEEIQLLISADNLPKAMRRLMDFVRDFSASADHLQKVVQYTIRFNTLKVAPNELGEKESSLLSELLEFLDGVEAQVLNLAQAQNN